jgi:hypothetical protein
MLGDHNARPPLAAVRMTNLHKPRPLANLPSRVPQQKPVPARQHPVSHHHTRRWFQLTLRRACLPSRSYGCSPPTLLGVETTWQANLARRATTRTKSCFPDQRCAVNGGDRGLRLSAQARVQTSELKKVRWLSGCRSASAKAPNGRRSSASTLGPFRSAVRRRAQPSRAHRAGRRQENL